MSSRGDCAWAAVPGAVAAASTAVAIGYVWLMNAQDDNPALWFLAGLLGAAALAGYATFPSAPGRSDAMVLSGLVLVPLGIISMFSVGLPILASGVVAIAFASRTRDHAPH